MHDRHGRLAGARGPRRLPRPRELDLDARELRRGRDAGRRLPRPASASVRGVEESRAHRVLHPAGASRVLHPREAAPLAPPPPSRRRGSARRPHRRARNALARARARPRRRAHGLDDHLRRFVPQLHRRRDHRGRVPRGHAHRRGDGHRDHRPRDPAGDRRFRRAPALGFRQGEGAFLECGLGVRRGGRWRHRVLRALDRYPTGSPRSSRSPRRA